MSKETLEELPPLLPLEFFSLSASLLFVKAKPSSAWMQKHCLLDSTQHLAFQEDFASVALGWNEEGLIADLLIEKPFEEAFYPSFSQGDAVEFFIDTRDRKSGGFSTRFCHHFLFLPSAVQGIEAQELTRFRSEDTHPLADPKDLEIQTTFHKSSYAMQIKIPAHCLHGFDPTAFDRLGFTYRIHRFKGSAQYFSSSGEHFSLEQHPRFWASFKLSK
jgi:hypothetical protein